MHIDEADLDWELLLNHKFSRSKKLIIQIIFDSLALIPSVENGLVVQTAASMMAIINALKDKSDWKRR